MDSRHHNSQGVGSSQQDGSPQPYSPYFMAHRPEAHESLEDVQCAQTQLLQSVEKVRAWQSNMQTQCDDLKRKLKESEETRERQHQNLLELQINLEQISFRYDSELKNRETLRTQIANTRTICDILQNHCQILSDTMQRCISERDRLTEQSDMILQQIYDLESKSAALKNQYKDKVESLTYMLSEERARIEREQQKSVEEHTRITNCYDILKEGLEAQLAQERSRNVVLEKRLMEANNQIEEIKQAEILATQQFSEQLLAAKEKSDQLEEDLMKHIKTEEELNACIETTRIQMEQLKIETANVVTESKNKESDMMLKLESMRVQNEEKVSDLRKALDEVQNQAADTEACLQHQVETCQAELETLKRQGQDTERALQHELHAALNSISELKQEIGNISEEYQDAKTHLDNQIKDLEDQIKAHHEAEQQTAWELTEARNELKQSHELHKAAQEVAAEKEEVLQAKLLDEKSRLETLQRETEILMEKQINAKANIAEMEMDKLKLVQELEVQREALEEFMRKVEEQDKECKRLKEELEASNEFVQTNKNINHDLKLKCQTLEGHLLSVKSEVHDLSNTMNTKDSKINELEKLLDQTNKTCKELENETKKLKLCEESSKKKSEEGIQMVNEQYLAEISVKNEKILELEAACQRQEQQVCEMEKILEEISAEFQTKLSLEKEKTKEELNMTKEKYMDSLEKKDKMLEEIQKRLGHSDQQVIHSKEQVTDLLQKLANAEMQIDQVTVDKENKLKIFLCDLDGFKKTAESRLMEITKLTNQLKELRNSHHQTQEQNDHISTELHQVQAQLKQTQIQLKHAKSEAHAAKTTADHMQATFAAYKAERKKRHMEAALRKSVLPGSSTTPSFSRGLYPQTPTNTEAPVTPRSILRTNHASTPQSAKSPNKRVKFTMDYNNSGSSSNSICFDEDQVGAMAMASDPKKARATMEAEMKEKEKEKLLRHKRAREDDEVENAHPPTENTFKKPADITQSDTSEDAFDWMS